MSPFRKKVRVHKVVVCLKRKKNLKNSLQEAYEAFLASQPKEEVLEQQVIVQEPLTVKPGAWLSYTFAGRTHAARIASIETPLKGWKWTGLPDERGTWIKMETQFESWKEGRACFWESDIYCEDSRYRLITEEEGLSMRRAAQALVEGNSQLCAAGMLQHGLAGGGGGFYSENKGMHHEPSPSSDDQNGFLSPGYD